MRNLSEDKLVIALGRGEVSAYEEVFRQHYKSLVVSAFCLLKDESEAEDLVRQFFLEARSSNTLASIHTAITSYLHTAVRNKCLNLLAKRAVELRRREPYRQSATCENNTADSAMEGRELLASMDLAINRLPDKRMQAFKLVYLEDKKYQEAADILGVSINSIQTHLRLALETLRKDFRKFNGYDQAALQALIAKERQVEFCFENQRWYDLKRTGKALEVLADHGIREKALRPWLDEQAFAMAPHKLLAPIPAEQILLNKIEQNEGY